MKQIKFKARLQAPHFTQAPSEEVEKWAKNIMASDLKQYQALKKVIKTRKDFDQIMGEPAERAVDEFIKGRSPAHKQRIMIKLRDSRSRAAKRYFLKRKETYETPKYKESVEAGKKRYEENWVKKRGPLWGYKKDGIKGLGALGAMALARPRDLRKWKKGTDNVEGDFDGITSKDKAGRLADEARKLIIRLGGIIIDTDYNPETIQDKNEALNQLVEKYRLPKFAPFRPNGASPRLGPPDDTSGDSLRSRDRVYPAFGGTAASHIDFIVVEIPDPSKPGAMKKWLALEIQVTLK